MIVTHRIRMDLDRRGVTYRIDAMQDDRYSRNVELSLYSNGTPWMLPEDVHAAITYRKPDGSGGTYDTLPDGSCAWQVRDNRVSVALAPQLSSVPGNVNLIVTLFRGDAKLSTFTLLLDVARNPALITSCEDEPLAITGFLPQVTEPALPGQHLIITAVDEHGRITSLHAEDVSEEIEFQQLQADWNQQDKTAPDFIRNKPAIPEGIPSYTEKDYGCYLTPSADGLIWTQPAVLAAAEDHAF